LINPKVSVVIATHNHAHFLPECLGSVRAQTYQDYEVIIVDNGSTDNTRELVQKLAWDKLRYYYQENTGSVSGPRNTGIRLARGEYVAFLDSDDSWYKEKLDEVMRILADNPAIDIISHDLLMVEKGKPNLVAKVGPLSSDMFKQLLIVGNCVCGSATVVKREILLKTKGFDESKDFVHVEDYEAWLRIAYQGYRFYFINKTLGEYKIHKSNLSHDYELVKIHLINVYNKHYRNLSNVGPLRKLLFYNRSIIKIYLATAMRFYKKRQYLKCLKSLIGSFLSYPFLLLKMAYVKEALCLI